MRNVTFLDLGTVFFIHTADFPIITIIMLGIFADTRDTYQLGEKPEDAAYLVWLITTESG